jgi:hypothetical protein
MDEHYYLYALTRADCLANGLGRGVDPRYAVELIPCGQLAALASRVGLDEFDVAKLEEGSADLPWLSQVAVRHNEIIAAAAQDSPVLPMRLGALFQSRSSLIDKMARHETDAAKVLRGLEGRQEWAVKVYVDADRAEKAVLSSPAPPVRRAPLADYLPPRPHGRSGPLGRAAGASCAMKELRSGPEAARGLSQFLLDENGTVPLASAAAQPPAQAVCGGGGTQYLVAKGLQAERRRLFEATLRQAVSNVEIRLKDMADSWQRLRPLPPMFGERPRKMVWNAAFLLPTSGVGSFRTACQRLAGELAPMGLILEVTGPWPPYHFCPSFEVPHENA